MTKNSKYASLCSFMVIPFKRLSHGIFKETEIIFPGQSCRGHVGPNVCNGDKPWTCLDDNGSLDARFGHYNVVPLFALDGETGSLEHPD